MRPREGDPFFDKALWPAGSGGDELLVTMTLMVGGTVSGGSGCNRCSGSAEVANGNGLTIGPLVTTRMACPGAAMELEDAYVARLGAAVAVGFQLGRLAVTWSLDERHGVLLFEPS